jgi:hypothetical protein
MGQRKFFASKRSSVRFDHFLFLQMNYLSALLGSGLFLSKVVTYQL